MLKTSLILVLFFFFGFNTVHSWDNGLARTPPMGWMSWAKYTCNVDCKNYPNACINEELYKNMIDRIVEEGYLELGYNTVNIDDCWTEMKRDPVTSRLVADRKRFPSGIQALVKYAHSRGVQLGIYQDVGTATCGGYPGTRSTNGSIDYTDIDARTFSEWGVDSLKLDGCNEPEERFNQSYPEYAKALSKQSHKITYACSWPAYLIDNMSTRDYEQIQANCNYWRNFDDIEDSWSSVQSIIEFYRKNVHTFLKYHGPGGWFDPDMLLIGNDGLSLEQSQTQMAFWCLWSAPLLMSNDLRDIRPEFKAILQNKHLIAVDQDPLGIMGHVVITEGKRASRQVWVKKLAPLTNGLNPYAVLYHYNATLGVPAIMSYPLMTLIPELKPTVSYEVLDLFSNATQIDQLRSKDNLTLHVKTSGAVRMVKLMPIA